MKSIRDLQLRSIQFKERSDDRYQWFRQKGNNYVPPVFSFLSDEEWRIILDWYDETDYKKTPDEISIPAISFIHGLIMGSRIHPVIQLGHHEGFSALIIGFMMKRIGCKNSFVSIDKNKEATEYTQKWISRAGLSEYVKLIVSDSANPKLVNEVKDYFKCIYKFILIDTSYEFDHTMKELELWYPELDHYGIIALNNASGFAIQKDQSNKGGVHKAINDWSLKWKKKNFILNGTIPPQYSGLPETLTYSDVNGLGIIQKV